MRLFFALIVVTFIELVTYIPLYIDALGQAVVPIDWAGFLMFEVAYILMFTVLVYAAWPLNEANYRELIILYFVVNFAEASLYMVYLSHFIHYFYPAIAMQSVISFCGYKVISNREGLTLKVLTILHKIPALSGWVGKKITGVFYSELDVLISQLFWRLFLASVLANGSIIAYAAYLDVAWLNGSLAADIDNGAFDIYLATDLFMNAISLVFTYLLASRLLADKAASAEVKI